MPVMGIKAGILSYIQTQKLRYQYWTIWRGIIYFL